MTHRILIVDDEDQIRRALSFALELKGYECLVTDSVDRAWSLIEERNDLDAVVTDLKMNDLDGYELLTRVRESGKRIPIIAMTGHASHEEARRAKSLGAVATLTKPFDLGDLMAQLESLLGPSPAMS